MIVGTSHGYLAIIDLRFHIIVQLYRHSSRKPVLHIQVMPSGYYEVAESVAQGVTSIPYVLVSCGNNEVAIWNVDTGDLYQVLYTVYVYS